MSKALKNGAVINITEQGEKKPLGKVRGNTFVAFERDVYRHLFRGGSETAQDAMENNTAAWGLDLRAMEGLYNDYGIQYVEIPTAQKTLYRVKMETLLGPKSFCKEFGGHRVQVFLPLEYWVETRPPSDLVVSGQGEKLARALHADNTVQHFDEMAAYVERLERELCHLLMSDNNNRDLLEEYRKR